MSSGVNIGIPFINKHGGFITEYQTVYDSFTTKPSFSVACAQNTFVAALVNADIWETRDQLCLFAQETNDDDEALINWINPGTFDATLVNGPAFVSLEGFTSDGSTSYINNNFIPSVDGDNYSLNDAGFGVYSRTDADEAKHVLSIDDTTHDSVLILRSSGVSVLTINALGNKFVGVDDSLGLFMANKPNRDILELWKNGSRELYVSYVAVGLPTITFYTLARNVGGTAADFSNAQISFMTIGSSLTESQNLILSNALEAYMDSNKKGVV